MSDQKAFSVTEDFESTGSIIFAKHAVSARRIGANQHADGDFTAVSCRRAKWADCFAETGRIPAAVMVEHGWHFDCCGCGVRIDYDLSHWQDRVHRDDTIRGMLAQARRYRRWTPADIIGYQNTAVFCDQLCKDTHDAFEAERNRRQNHAIEVFKARVLKRFPGVEFRDRPHAYATMDKGRWRLRQVAVAFDFPGMEHGPAHYRWDAESTYRKAEKPHFTCCNGDREAFEAFAKVTAL